MTGHGPYETEDQARRLPAVRAIHEAFRAGTGDLSGVAMITAACEEAGVGLGAFDRRILAWMSNWEPTTCAVFAGIIRRAYFAGLNADGERLGYVVVTFNQASGRPGLDYPDLHEGITDAMCERDRKREETATTGRGERHVIAEVTEMEDGE